MISGFVSLMTEKVFQNEKINWDDAFRLSSCKGSDLMELFAGANRIRERFHGNRVDLCSVVNAKSGNCNEDCRFCAQSSRHLALSPEYPLMAGSDILKVAEDAWEKGARRFCVSTSGKRVSPKEIDDICDAVSKIKQYTSLYCCATLGDLDPKDFAKLKSAGLDRFHHNLETSRSFFPNICTTHSYDDRLETIFMAREAGLSTCVGGILGMGEDVSDWLELAFAIRELNVDSIPLNFLMPIPGTPLEKIEPIEPMDALRAISIFRFTNPETELRICGGRISALQDMHSFIFFSGANGMMVGNYLTCMGREVPEDLRMIRQLGMDPQEVLL